MSRISSYMPILAIISKMPATCTIEDTTSRHLRKKKKNQELSMFLHLLASDINYPGKWRIIPLLDHFGHEGPNGTHLCLVVGWYCQRTMKSTDLPADLQHANILFSVIGGQHKRLSLQRPKFCPVRWLEGAQPDNSAPEYLVTSQRPQGQLDDVDASIIIIKIGDMGGGKVYKWSYQVLGIWHYPNSCMESARWQKADDTARFTYTWIFFKRHRGRWRFA